MLNKVAVCWLASASAYSLQQVYYLATNILILDTTYYSPSVTLPGTKLELSEACGLRLQLPPTGAL
jgi:hypothetical protein